MPSLSGSPTVLLATARVCVRTAENRVTHLRALLDQGSNYSFLSESLCQILRTKRHRANIKINGFGDKCSGYAKSYVSLTLEPCHGQGPRLPLTGYVFDKLTSYTGSRTRPLDSWSLLRELDLADPDPSDPSPIHLLIGADLYGSILRNDLRQGPLGTPTAQRTIFGWIVSGPTGARSAYESVPVLNCIATDDTNRLLERFWEIEEIRARPSLSEADERYESHFRETHSRDSEGRYVVWLPFKDGPPIDIGDSFKSASLLYRKLENRLRTKPDLAKEYHAFLREYEALGHMELVRDASQAPSQRVYLPHHPVVRESSSTTKIRVVFNASHKPSNGTTLNDHLFVGPKLQRKLRDVLTRWRRFWFVYCADVEKMFRQIRVKRSDCNYQFIL
ncbi:uncharacterized protein [Temnothorax nylanderi]|uniref:uncharacterized protein n=1 Tax=Temnothorax nylanderi TaxID=102681 RepID=UPI003A8C38AB